MREREIEKYLVKRVKALGGEVRKVKWIGRRGAPDRVVMLPEYAEWDDGAYLVRAGSGVQTVVPSRREPARTIWVELKATGEKPEPHQLREHERMRAMGQRVEVIDSIEGVDEVLK